MLVLVLRILFVCVCLCNCRLVEQGRSACTLSLSEVPLAGGETTAVYALSNDQISISCIPTLGGKINSIKVLNDAGDYELLSRSETPYSLRQYGTKYSNTEVDGIDECFPALNVSRYPVAPWRGRVIPDHGEVCQLTWEVQQADKEALVCSVKSKVFPYEFVRSITLEDKSVILNYRVRNLSDHVFHCCYTFHPLFKGTSKSAMSFPDEAKIKLDMSSRRYLGREGSRHTWGDFKVRSGKLFKEQQFIANSRRHFQYYILRAEVDHATLSYGDGYAVTLSWSKELFPYLGVWNNQAAGPRVNQIAPEPTNSMQGRLDSAFRAKEHLSIEPRGELTWQIRLDIEAP